jgi:ribosomal protein S18 acetylase RimI-like enzyme
VIRPARADDVDGIAAVHAATWQAAYAGILSASTLQFFTVTNRRKFWAGVGLGDPVPDRPIFVALDDDVIVGFAVCGPPRNPELRFDAELYVLNVDPGHWRRGIGRHLFARCVDHLSEHGRNSFYLWVLTANERARRVYESLKGKPLADHVRDADFDGVAVPEIAYRWAKLPVVPIGGRAA